MPPKRTTKGKKVAAASGKEKITRVPKTKAAAKASTTKDKAELKETVNNLTTKVLMSDSTMTEKKNRLKAIDAIQLDQDAEVEKAEWATEKKKYDNEMAKLAKDGENNEEEDSTFQARASRLERHYARSEKAHEVRLEKLFADMQIQRESLDDEAKRVSKEVENLRVHRKKVVAELAAAKKELTAAE